MQIHSLTTGQLREHCYIIAKDNNDCLIIDPGDDAELISDTIFQNNLNPISIIATHGHFDHVMAIYELQLNFNIPFFVNKKDQFLLDRLNSTVKHYLGNIEIFPPKEITYIGTSDFKKLEKDFNFQTLHTPGHTPGSISLFFEDRKESYLFAGDLIFYGGVRGRTDFKYGDEKELYRSIKKVLELPGDTIVYSGHGKNTTIKFEKKIWELTL